MNKNQPRAIQRGMLLVLTFILITVSGCAAIPPAFSKASWALSTVSYATTTKGPSDHAISYVAKKDCSLFRLVKFQPVCQPITENSNQSILSWILSKFSSPEEEPVLSYGPQVAASTDP